MGARVLITAKSVSGSRAAIAKLEAAGCEVRIENTPAPFDESWAIAKVRDIDALVFAMEPMNARLIAAAERLKIIARPGVGYDNVDLAACTQRRIPVTVAAGTNHESVADFTFGLMLAIARGLVGAVNSVQEHGWDRPTGSELWRKTLAVIGPGRIGQAVARRARGFDMRVLAVGNGGRRDADFASAAGVEYVPLEHALREADFVSLHAPLTPQTANLIRAETLRLMKPTAFLINTSRGGLVDEPALAEAVRSRRIAGAAVDVLCVQGAKSPSPLIGVPNILVTPHMATLSRESMERVAQSVADSVLTVISGGRPEHVVNPSVYDATPRGE